METNTGSTPVLELLPPPPLPSCVKPSTNAKGAAGYTLIDEEAGKVERGCDGRRRMRDRRVVRRPLEKVLLRMELHGPDRMAPRLQRRNEHHAWMESCFFNEHFMFQGSLGNQSCLIQFSFQFYFMVLQLITRLYSLRPFYS